MGKRYGNASNYAGSLTGTAQSPIVDRVLVPCLQAAITSLGVGAIGGLGAWALDYASDSLGVGAMLGAVAFMVSWLALIRQASAVAVCVTDDTTMMPLAPMPSSPSRLVLVNAKSNAEPGRDRAARFAAFVEACELDSSTRRLRGLGFTDGEIVDFRDALLRLGYARWNTTDKRGGWALTADSETILGAMA